MESDFWNKVLTFQGPQIVHGGFEKSNPLIIYLYFFSWKWIPIVVQLSVETECLEKVLFLRDLRYTIAKSALHYFSYEDGYIARLWYLH